MMMKAPHIKTCARQLKGCSEGDLLPYTEVLENNESQEATYLIQKLEKEAE